MLEPVVMNNRKNGVSGTDSAGRIRNNARRGVTLHEATVLEIHYTPEQMHGDAHMQRLWWVEPTDLGGCDRGQP